MPGGEGASREERLCLAGGPGSSQKKPLHVWGLLPSVTRAPPGLRGLTRQPLEKVSSNTCRTPLCLGLERRVNVASRERGTMSSSDME